MPEMPTVFITGGTGFIGRNLIIQLLRRDYVVRALVRTGSEHKLPVGCKPILGDVLDKNSFVSQIAPAETFIQLVGVTHPNPAEKDEFRAIDLGSARAAIEAAREAGIKHFVYVSVSQPAPVMISEGTAQGKRKGLTRRASNEGGCLRSRTQDYFSNRTQMSELNRILRNGGACGAGALPVPKVCQNPMRLVKNMAE
jgi:NAD(P)-dependent dehydrogenase (short-subunit alcohol dehydrogenase family)